MANLTLTIGPLALFALVASITPGPNNLLLMRSGASFGVRRSLWHLVGVQAGFVGLVLLSHIGAATLLMALPGLFGLLRWACFLYLLWLAWLILLDARAASAEQTRPAPGRPMRFVEALLFQLINPKAWMMSITIASAFYGGMAPTGLDLATAIFICLCIGGPSMLVWTLWGASIDRVLRRPSARRLFGYLMAALVAATAVWMLR